MPVFVRFGAPLILSGLSYFAIHFSDHFFLSSAVSLAKLGRSTLAYRFALTVYALVGDSFAKSWTVSPYRHINDPGWQEQFARVAAFFTFAVAWAGFAIAVFCPELLRVTVPASSFSPRLLLPVLVLAYVVRDVADFRHPLRGNPSRTAFRDRLIDRVTEWLVLQQSDAVIANTEASAAALARRYPARAGKTHTICNGFDPDDWMEPLPRADRARGVISHVGSFYGVRTPAPVRCVFEPAGRKRRDAARRHPVPPGRLQRSRTPRCRGACLSGFAGAGLPARRDPDRLTA